MIEIKVGAIYSQLIGEISDVDLAQLRHVLSYEDADAQHKRSAFFAQGKKRAAMAIPDRISLLTPKKKTFRTGLLHRVMETCDQLGVVFTINDLRVEGPPEHFTTIGVDPIEYFRDYQREAIRIAINQKCGMIRMATGGGKTQVICGIVAELERPAVVLVHRLDLMRQCYDRLRSLILYPEIVGKVGGGEFAPSILTVCTIQTICAALGINYKRTEFDDRESVRGIASHADEVRELLQRAQVCILDEAHHAPARTVSEVLAYCTKATWRLGFTATDWRDDGADLLIEAAFGPRIFDYSLSDLIQSGWLVPADVTMYPMQEPQFVGVGATWNQLYADYYTNNKEFHLQVLRQNAEWYEAGRHILTLVTAIQHGLNLQRMHEAFGIPTVFLSGSDSQRKRERVMNDVRAGHLRCLIGTSIADEGLDLPILDALNIAGGGKSTTRVYQRLGRTLRPVEGKTSALVADYRVKGDEVLARHAGRRANIYRKEPAFRFTEVKE